MLCHCCIDTFRKIPSRKKKKNKRTKEQNMDSKKKPGRKKK